LKECITQQGIELKHSEAFHGSVQSAYALMKSIEIYDNFILRNTLWSCHRDKALSL